MKRKSKSLHEWVEAYGGTLVLAEELAVSRRTVNLWLAKVNYPKVENMRQLIKLSKKQLSYESIINSCDPEYRGHVC